MILLPDDPDGRTTQILLDKIEDISLEPITDGNAIIEPRVSVGAAVRSPSATTVIELVNEADQAMYVAKRSGTPTFANDALRRRARAVATIDSDARDAFATGQITYHFQPVRDLTSNRLTGIEALIRWLHPQLGWVPPTLLIERVERAGRVDAFSEWSLRNVLRCWNRIRALLPEFDDLTISLNLSPLQIAWRGYTELHRRLLDEYSIDAREVLVETNQSPDEVIGLAAERTLGLLSDANVPLTLDNFGSGDRELSYLARFPIKAVKFAPQLVHGIGDDHRAQSIVGGLQYICEDLGVETVGKGIESEGSTHSCLSLGIAHGQGRHIGYPVNLASFVATVRNELPDAHFPIPRPMQAEPG